ncbi:5059_t:CDS:2 [Paraglomus brasilianum]|uniref:5059_t:CDS:1 n=1 Tax=Paraglomus brasilianum TaxID=144538 RepID=A0A9N9F4X0_9GLOM|nr:5059_t:CDS:2 [Paraglomus brasilianum]
MSAQHIHKMIRALSDAVTDTSFIPPDDNYTSSDPSDIPNFNPPTGDPSDPSSSDSFPTFSNDSFSLSDYDKLVYQADVVYNLNNWLSVVSIVGGLIVLIVMISIWLYDRKLVNRVSLRLTAVISFVDILAAISVIAYTRVSGEDNIGCMILGWTLSFLPQCYLFLTVMIAFNLQLVFLHRRKVASFSDKWYIPAAIFIAFIINLPPAIFHVFGYESTFSTCLYRTDEFSPKAILYWKLFTFIIPCAVTMIYCTVILSIIVFKIKFVNKKIASIGGGTSSRRSEKERQKEILVLKLVSRITLYAVVPLITVGGIVVTYIFDVVAPETPFGVVVWSVVGSSLPGFFNCLAFLFDPAIHNALRKIKKDLISKYGPSSPFSPPMSPLSPLTAFSPTIIISSNNSSKLSSTHRGSYINAMRPNVKDLKSGNMRLSLNPVGMTKLEQRLTRIEMERRENRSKFMVWFVSTFLIGKGSDHQRTEIGSNGANSGKDTSQQHQQGATSQNTYIPTSVASPTKKENKSGASIEVTVSRTPEPEPQHKIVDMYSDDENDNKAYDDYANAYNNLDCVDACASYSSSIGQYSDTLAPSFTSFSSSPFRASVSTFATGPKDPDEIEIEKL